MLVQVAVALVVVTNLRRIKSHRLAAPPIFPRVPFVFLSGLQNLSQVCLHNEVKLVLREHSFNTGCFFVGRPHYFYQYSQKMMPNS